MKDILLAQGKPLYTPMIEIVGDESIDLPATVVERLESFFTNCGYGTTVRSVCHWYVKEMYAISLGVIHRKESCYEPLLKILEMGGYFWEHDGGLSLGGVTSIRYIGR